MQITNITQLELDRPEPITDELAILEYTKNIDPKNAVEALLNGSYVLVADLYSSGTLVLESLKKQLQKREKSDSFQSQREYRQLFHQATQFLLVEIVNHRIHLRKSPEIGWLNRLYPELDSFLLPFVTIQGMNSSWQWYEKGIQVPGLNETIHPFYGTYFPTRFEHIDLFVDYLKKHPRTEKVAFEVGIGSGVLSKLLHQFGFEVHASDINPNALIGIMEEEMQSHNRFNLYFGDLFANTELKSDLIVFNPPWVPLPKDVSGIDLAIYYDSELFPRFFEQASKHLNPSGELVLLFSNIASLMIPKFKHPIKEELETQKRFQLVTKTSKKVGASSTKTTRKTLWRDKEFVECWVLKLL